MKTKRCRFWYLIACLLLNIILPPICHADDRARDRASLRGIENIVVRVHSFEREWAAELAKSGLTESVVQATIERQLEKSGIAVISEEASKRTGTEGILNVRTNFLNPEPLKKKFITAKEEEIEKFDPQKRYVYVIRLNLRQPVLLQRNPEAPISAITWQTESVGFRRLALIREDIEKVVNVFSEAYLSENPGIGE